MKTQAIRILERILATIAATSLLGCSDTSGLAGAEQNSPRNLLSEKITSGSSYSCAIATDSSPYCWGERSQGKLGVGIVYDDQFTPKGVLTTQTFVAIDAGDSHTCALNTSGKAFCWGWNNRYQLGTGTTESSNTPTPVSGAQSFRTIVTGLAHTCALDNTGVAYCWGYNSHGQLGNGTRNSQLIPEAVPVNIRFNAITAGDYFTCGIASDATTHCWGQDRYNYQTDHTLSPTPLNGAPPFVQISAGSSHVCGLTVSGAVFCRGWNQNGQLGDETTDERLTPVLVKTSVRFTAISAGGNHTCGIASGGQVYCWGWNLLGQLGDGTKTDRNVPTLVSSPLAFKAVAVGAAHSCAISTTSTTFCWGVNGNGAVGDGGSLSARLVPAIVTIPQISR